MEANSKNPLEVTHIRLSGKISIMRYKKGPILLPDLLKQSDRLNVIDSWLSSLEGALGLKKVEHNTSRN